MRLTAVGILDIIYYWNICSIHTSVQEESRMESTIILKTDALNALVAAHRLMQEMSVQSQASVESVHFERGFSAALSTIATVFGLDLEIGEQSVSAGAHWRVIESQ